MTKKLILNYSPTLSAMVAETEGGRISFCFSVLTLFGFGRSAAYAGETFELTFTTDEPDDSEWTEGSLTFDEFEWVWCICGEESVFDVPVDSYLTNLFGKRAERERIKIWVKVQKVLD